MIPSFAICLAAVGCGNGDEKAGPTTTPINHDPTFTNVRQQVVNAKCSGPTCHSSSLLSGFSLTSNLYDELVNKPAGGPKCKTSVAADGGALIRVIPNDPDNSLLYLKITQAAPCGDGMPVNGVLTSDQIDLVRRWIEAGAPND